MNGPLFLWWFSVLIQTVTGLVYHHGGGTPFNHRPSSRTIKIKYGTLRGMVINFPGDRNLQPVESFLGIPYASPPIGKLRFMPPVTPAIWPGIKNANNHGPVCPQKLPLPIEQLKNETLALQKMTRGRLKILIKLNDLLKNQSEDCLYLNIYSPLNPSNGMMTRLPVLVFIHGESYDWNSGSVYDGSVLASHANIVVVTINFRLGVLGFFPSLGGTARGNFGLMDQVAALHWIQENIREFHGDERNVTIIGYGHGAACVNFLMLSPMARGLFHRAIMISGSALSPWAIASDAVYHGKNLAKILGCWDGPVNRSIINSHTSKMSNNHGAKRQDVLECLRHKTVTEILSVDLKIPTHLTAFGPIIDGIVIPGPPSVMMSKSNSIFSNYELIFGVTRAESYNLFSMYDEKHGIDLPRRDRLLRTLIRNLFNYHLQEIFLTILNEYTDWTRPYLHPISLFDSIVDIFSDALIVAPTIRAGMLHSKQSRHTYFFTFSHQTEYGPYPTRLGCIHGQDMAYLFGAPLVNGWRLSWFPYNYTKTEIALSKNYIHYLGNFIKTGNPNNNGSSWNRQNVHHHHLANDDDDEDDDGDGGDEKMKPTISSSNNNFQFWAPYEEIQQKYISFDTNKIILKDYYLAHRLSYWFNLLPQLHKPGSSDSKDHHLLESHNNAQTYDGIIRYGSLSSPVSFNTYFNLENISNNNDSFTNQTDDHHHQRNSDIELTNNQQFNNDTWNESNNIDGHGSALSDLATIMKSNTGLQPSSSTSFTGTTGNNSSFSMIVQSNNLYTWLSLIIAIGCSLLILNVLVFAGFYYHKDRNRLETKLIRQKHPDAQKKCNKDPLSIPLYRINSITDNYNSNKPDMVS